MQFLLQINAKSVVQAASLEDFDKTVLTFLTNYNYYVSNLNALLLTV